LHKNIEKLVLPINKSIQVFSTWEKIDVVLPDQTDQNDIDTVVERLTRTPGIESLLLITSHQFSSLQQAINLSVNAYSYLISDKSFRVRVKRRGKHEFTSLDAERQIGSELLKSADNARVDLTRPDITVDIEIDGNTLSLVEQKFTGLGGYPIGQQGGVLSLISGGYDSSVASYFSIRRGLKTHFCFFNLGGEEHEVAVKHAANYLWQNYSSTHRVKFVTVPFEDVVNAILKAVEPSLMGVVLKRMMLRAASRIAEDLHLTTLVTGECVGQVSSQTLANLKLIDSSTDCTLLRPVSLMDKNAIVNQARKIGVADMAATVPEYCSVISKKPSAKVDKTCLLQNEADFDFSILEQAIANHQVQSIEAVISGKVQQASEVQQLSELSTNDVIVDIRSPEQRDSSEKSLKWANIIEVPFYCLHDQLWLNDKSKRYLLYCDNGIMSKVQAHYLQAQGHSNVHVYRLSKLTLE
ncbi:MAG: tRNA uracil 4-sulfurtransferase ThiI, partial [Kangiellaceae bacterium]|nr:tRNA uracil 4-sulfurtransferase ThiI [Kangiellaceae bacterium]